MAIINKQILNVEKLLKFDLSIPNYQRPYKWTVRNMNQLFNDILAAYRNNLSEYRLGTIVIHRYDQDDKTVRDIVDGQQRMISLHLINDVLQKKPTLNIPKNKSYISQNYYEAKRLYEALSNGDGREQEGFSNYFTEKCHLIKIEIDNEMEAFQFFDSQNARGKALEAHDLLKAYHLREMATDSEAVKLKLIEKWEEQNTYELATLFSTYLYKIKMWLTKRHAHFFNRDGIELFKGISLEHQYNYVQYHKAAYLFMEKFNRENHQELLGIDALIPFQIDQQLLAGRRFFEYTHHYINLTKKVKEIAISIMPDSVSPAKTKEQTGTRYVRELLQSLLLYFYDRFGIEQRNKSIEALFLIYCYQLRCVNYAVYKKSINKYALGNNDNLNSQLNLFEKIKNAQNPREIEMIVLDDLYLNDITPKYQSNDYADLRERLAVIKDEGEN